MSELIISNTPAVAEPTNHRSLVQEPAVVSKSSPARQEPPVIVSRRNNPPNPTTTLTLADLLRLRVSHETKHPAPAPVVCIAGANYGLEGMISALTGPPKSGKTTVVGYMLATALTKIDPTHSLHVRSSPANSRNVVCLDFEQHVSSTQALHDKVLLYAGLQHSPDNLHIISLLEYSIEQRTTAMRLAFREWEPHLLIIDGLADMLAGVNDEEKSNQLIEELALLASCYNTCVVVVIHENKGGGTVRGHLGSQIERKCAGLIAIRKDRESKVHTIESRLIRIGDDFETVCFRYSEEDRRMVLLDALSTEDFKKRMDEKKAGKDKDPEYIRGLLKLCFGAAESMHKKELIGAIMHYDKDANSDKTAQRRINGAIELGLLTETNKVCTRTEPTQPGAPSNDKG